VKIHPVTLFRNFFWFSRYFKSCSESKSEREGKQKQKFDEAFGAVF
jgi:hypothetical protein